MTTKGTLARKHDSVDTEHKPIAHLTVTVTPSFYAHGTISGVAIKSLTKSKPHSYRGE